MKAFGLGKGNAANIVFINLAASLLPARRTSHVVLLLGNLKTITQATTTGVTVVRVRVAITTATEIAIVTRATADPSIATNGAITEIGELGARRNNNVVCSLVFVNAWSTHL